MRNFGQVIIASEEDSFGSRVSGIGTVNVTIGTVNAGEIIFVTDLSASTDKGTALLNLYDGTSYRYGPLSLTANSPYVHPFSIPLKISTGTVCKAEMEGMQGGNQVINIGGYVRKRI